MPLRWYAILIIPFDTDCSRYNFLSSGMIFMTKIGVVKGPMVKPSKNRFRTGIPEQTFSMLKPDIQGFRKCIDQNYCNLWWVNLYFITSCLDYWFQLWIFVEIHHTDEFISINWHHFLCSHYIASK